MDDVTTSVETGAISHEVVEPTPTTEAPQSSTDLIGEYLAGRSQPEATSEALPPQESQPETPVEPVETEATRAERRVQEVLAQQAEMQRQMAEAHQMNQQLQMFIMSNPTARAEYERLQGGPQQPQQPQQEQLPELDPFDPASIQAHATQWALQAVQSQYGDTVNELMELKQQLQAQVEQQQQAAHAQLTQSVDQVFYDALPTVKENPAHWYIAEGLFKQTVQTGIQNGQQPSQDFFLQAAKYAADQAKQAIQGLGGPKPSVTGVAPKVFTEGTGNLVSSVGEQPKDVAGMISAHLQFNK